MIYEWGRYIVHIGKSIRHFFRALFCSKYYVYIVWGCCELTDSFCEYQWCPKVKERKTKNEQH